MKTLYFKAWDKKNQVFPKETYCVSFFDILQGFVPLSCLERKEDFDWLMYVNERDRKGNMICEEDIVQWFPVPEEDWALLEIEKIVPAVGIVKLHSDGFYIEPIRAGKKIYKEDSLFEEITLEFYSPDGSEFLWSELEVVGNSYESSIT